MTEQKKFSDLTIPEKFRIVLAYMNQTDAPAEFAEFIKERGQLADKKRVTAKSKPTKTQLEAEALKIAVHEFLTTVETGVRANEVFVALELSSPQKATNLLTALVKEGKAVRHEDKKVVTFTAL